MTGNFVDSCEPGKLNEIGKIGTAYIHISLSLYITKMDASFKCRRFFAGKWHKPWFFKHVESFLDSGKATEFIPLRDYYHRFVSSRQRFLNTCSVRIQVCIKMVKNTVRYRIKSPAKYFNTTKEYNSQMEDITLLFLALNLVTVRYCSFQNHYFLQFSSCKKILLEYSRQG